MSVKLIAITKPIQSFAEESGCDSPEKLISWCARVSNPNNQDKYDTSKKLLQYCLKHEHFSIFEMTNVVMEIKTTRDIGRQILRHRSFSFQEFSQRYAEVEFDDFIHRECRTQDVKNRQNSNQTYDDSLITNWGTAQTRVVEEAIKMYKWALEQGIAKEQARALLPEGLTPSVMYMNGTLRSWIHYIELRSSNGTQKEHRLIAEECKKIITNNFTFLKEHFEHE